MIGQQVVLQRDGLEGLLQALRQRGFRVLGPTVRDGRSSTTRSRPRRSPGGLDRRAGGGHYRLNAATTTRCSATRSARTPGSSFSSARGSRSGAPTRRRRRLSRRDRSREPAPSSRSSACASCDLHAIAIQDRVFLDGPYVDPHYRARREERVHRRGQLRPGGRHLLLRLDADRPAGEPRLRPGADRARRRGEHRFVVEVGQRARARVCWRELPHRDAPPADDRGGRRGRRRDGRQHGPHAARPTA